MRNNEYVDNEYVKFGDLKQFVFEIETRQNQETVWVTEKGKEINNCDVAEMTKGMEFLLEELERAIIWSKEQAIEKNSKK